MSNSCDSDSDVKTAAEAALAKILLANSKELYEKVFEELQTWMTRKWFKSSVKSLLWYYLSKVTAIVYLGSGICGMNTRWVTEW